MIFWFSTPDGKLGVLGRNVEGISERDGKVTVAHYVSGREDLVFTDCTEPFATVFGRWSGALNR